MDKYDNTMMQTCDTFANLSKCSRKKVGSVISKEGRIISTGYNGTPAGWKYRVSCSQCKGKGCHICKNKGYENLSTNEYGKDCGEILVKNYCGECNVDYINQPEYHCEEYCPKCNQTLVKEYKTDHSITLHAEANAILWAGRQGISCEGATLYCTYSPCSECSKLIMQAGITRVVYKHKYQNITGIKLMSNLGIIVEEFSYDEY